jgi:hypothetical protein
MKDKEANYWGHPRNEGREKDIIEMSSVGLLT